MIRKKFVFVSVYMLELVGGREFYLNFRGDLYVFEKQFLFVKYVLNDYFKDEFFEISIRFYILGVNWGFVDIFWCFIVN